MKNRFAERIDPNDDGKATFDEVRQYLSNFNPAVSDQQVTSFIRRRDLNRQYTRFLSSVFICVRAFFLPVLSVYTIAFFRLNTSVFGSF